LRAEEKGKERSRQQNPEHGEERGPDFGKGGGHEQTLWPGDEPGPDQRSLRDRVREPELSLKWSEERLRLRALEPGLLNSRRQALLRGEGLPQLFRGWPVAESGRRA